MSAARLTLSRGGEMKLKLEADHLSAGGVMAIQKFKVPGDGVYVHNVLGTRDEVKPDGYRDFLDYWVKNSGCQLPAKCVALDPHRNIDGDKSDASDIVGAHVRIDDERCPEDWAWIVPLCKHCNNDDRTWCIWIPEGVVLVPVKLSRNRKTATNDMDPWVKNYWRFYGERQ